MYVCVCTHARTVGKTYNQQIKRYVIKLSVKVHISQFFKLMLESIIKYYP